MLSYTILCITFLCLNSVLSSNLECDKIDLKDRFDCFPDNNTNELECEHRGCCWSPASNNKNYNSAPSCFFPKNFPNYKVVSKKSQTNDLTFSIEKSSPTFRPKEILKLQAKIISETKQRVRVQITDPNKNRFQVPLTNDEYKVDSSLNSDETDYEIQVEENPFSIKIYRKKSNKLVFDSSVAPLIYADQFIQFSTRLTNDVFYGLGERQANLANRADWNRFALWNRDIGPEVNTNLYGTHPFYMSMDQEGNAMGLFLLNSNAMEIKVNPTPALTFITLGGVIDFFIYMGPSPADVIIQHTEVIGRSQMPQYFTLGFHLSRWGYPSAKKLSEIINRNRAIGIPYDVQWTDIDAMERKLDWTYDNETYASLPEIVKDLHEKGQYYINIIDPGIKNETGYYPYESGVQQDIFIKYHNSTEDLIGLVWPGFTTYPDFTNPKTTEWWSDQAKRFHKVIPFDGLWIDMNEPSNFFNGSIIGCPGNDYDDPPFVPKILGETLYAKTICPSAEQYLSNHYNLHNLYGHYKSISSYKALLSLFPNKRPFVLTRSTFSGTGKYAAHWSGDNRASWEDMHYSIPAILTSNMFGMSQVGADICGFNDDTTEELCIRWMQLGIFYPFMRNHNHIDGIEQDPAAFSKPAQDIMKKALMTRYALIPYLYNLLYRSNQFGETVVRPLFFEFPHDTKTYKIDHQFMFGPSLLITPVLEKGAKTVQGYFPNDTWYHYRTGELLDLRKGQNITLDAPLDDINVHFRGGFVLPYQQPGLTTTESRKNNFGFVVTLKQNGTKKYASGSLFWDDGESVDSIKSKKYNFFDLQADENNLIVKKVWGGYKTRMIFSDFGVFGVDQEVKQVTINGQLHDKFSYDDKNKTLTVLSFSIDMLNEDLIKISWS